LKPDLVILDILMDKTDPGCKVLTTIKDDPRTADTPVLACTALTRDQVRAQTKEQPLLSGILSRPFEVETLEAMVTDILSGAERPAFGVG
jgi:CheY-like chemotaxis protein